MIISRFALYSGFSLLLFSFLYCDKREKSNQKRKKCKRLKVIFRVENDDSLEDENDS